MNERLLGRVAIDDSYLINVSDISGAEKCHVWTAPAGKDFLHARRLVIGAAMCSAYT